MDKFRSDPFYMRVFGEYALFTDPMTKGGGEKFTYQVPTYQALKGIVEACYWKPIIYYVIDAVKIIKPIQTETKGILSPMKSGKTDRNYYTYLKDVDYLVKYHFRWNMNRPNLQYDANEKKHEQILLRSMERGGRRDVYLGTRECLGYIERIRYSDFENIASHYEGETISLGIMFHSFTYPDEAYDADTRDVLTSNFCPIIMNDGIINFIEPKDCKIQHNLGGYTIKQFNDDSLTSSDEVFEAYKKKGVIQNGLDESTAGDI